MVWIFFIYSYQPCNLLLGIWDCEGMFNGVRAGSAYVQLQIGRSSIILCIGMRGAKRAFPA